MSEAFRGEFNQKVDSKARVSIPAAFRRVLEAGDPNFPGNPRARFILVYGGETRRFLECYTLTEMARLERRVARMPVGDKKRIYLTRNLITRSLEVEIDDDGRIVLPPKGRDKIELAMAELKDGSEATFAGMLNAFQIWKRDTYDSDSGQAGAEQDLLAEGEDMLSLLPPDDDDTEG
ncbi:division/cell wall cluster transcriptional repressor MraZ [Paracoccaceae bacterium Fryx2]|nr:division/cell wall cluster transcriptional repressor MraZ [Paracoccaceae bacterium Fryx2]